MTLLEQYSSLTHAAEFDLLAFPGKSSPEVSESGDDENHEEASLDALLVGVGSGLIRLLTEYLGYPKPPAKLDEVMDWVRS